MFLFFKKRIYYILFFLLISSNICFAQAVPGAAKAGQVEKDLDRAEKKFKKEPATSPIEVEIPKEELAIPDGKKIFVKSFDFRQNTIFKTGYLKKITKKYTNKELSLQELKGVCNLINDAYKRRGYFLARAYLPVQDIKDGIIIIEIIEGRLGEIKVEGNEFYKKKFLINHFRPTYKGVIHYNRLLKTLLVLDDYPDLEVKAILQKGAKPYTTDLILKISDKFPVHFGIDYNNFGSRYVSRQRAGATFEYSNAVLQGDKIYLRGVSGSPERNLKFAYADYSLPIDSFGSRLSFNYTWSDFNVRREFRALDAGGQSKIYSTELSHPLIRTLTATSDFKFGFDYKQMKNYLLGAVSNDDELRVFKTSLSGDFVDSFQGRNYYSLMVSGGVPNIMGGLKKRDDPRASRVGAGGEFVKGNIDFARFQQFFFGTNFLIKGSLQTASRVLTVPEQFSIGGADTVRGFPESEHLGDYGYCATFEWRFPLPFIADANIPLFKRTYRDTIQFLGFVDYGKTFLRNPQAGESKHDEITGVGFGTRLNFGNDFTFRVDVGYPVGGDDSSDGAKSAVYLQALKRF
ncbi:MAG: ShlB/FhaC/HecB family hemolysin secretion/activation protein [Candidatus Omnitrophota bacterium]